MKGDAMAMLTRFSPFFAAAWCSISAICMPGMILASDDTKSNTAFNDTGMALELQLRSRNLASQSTGRILPHLHQTNWDPAKTAIVICDMWNEHWCKGATRRVAEMAPRMNEVASAAREKGVLIIHCPSSCMDFYKDTQQRKLAQTAPQAATRRPLEAWCHLDAAHEGPLPIDDSDGGCDCQPQCEQGSPWRRQIETIEIKDGDAITDSGEAYHLMKSRGIENVIVMGVHTNMCVLGRPFSIRQLVYQGMNVVLMRDMTDTMYNSRMAPFLPHAAGTDLVVEHIERHWCPTITSDQLIGGSPFVFAEDDRKHLVLVMAEDEYETAKTLPPFVDRYLRDDFRVTLVFGEDEGGGTTLPGIEALTEADVALVSIRRKALPAAQLKVIREYIEAGKPLVAIRTTSHAFSLRDAAPPAGHALWPDFDQQVLGGRYEGHFGVHPDTLAWVKDGAEDHPLLAGVRRDQFRVASTLYQYGDLADTTRVLMVGRVGEEGEIQPVAWTNRTPWGGDVFYTSLGHAGDFRLPVFEQLLINAVRWTSGVPLEKARQ
jgi:nicotinamidase-related amidase/type 1 glutamine amidotransferase